MTQGTLSNSRRARALDASPVQVGEIIAGKYRVEKIIAAGGMGVVVSARHEVLKQTVAIKFLIPQAMEDQTVARFLREAKAAARIQSERVVRVYDCGTLPTGVPYMVMEHLVGVDLAQHIRSGGAMAPDEAVDLVCSALEGVAEAHVLGIVHRDLKPANLFLVGVARRPYSVKVLDFGISKVQPGAEAPVDDELTGTAMMLGSPRYVSPEQARNSSNVDVRADVWSIGVILYELLDGKCPFSGTTIGEVLSKVLLFEPPRLDERRDDVPPGLGDVIRKCLERDADHRYPNAVELARALAPFGSELARFHVQRIERIFDLPHAPVLPISSPRAVAAMEAEQATKVIDTGSAPVIPEPSAAAPADTLGSVLSDGSAEPGEASVAGGRTEGAWTQVRGRERRNLAWLGATALVVALLVGAGIRYLLPRAHGQGSASDGPSATVPTDTAAPASSGAEPVPSSSETIDPAIEVTAAGAAGGSADADATASASGVASASADRPTRRPGGGTATRTPATAPTATAPRPTSQPTAAPKGVLDRSD